MSLKTKMKEKYGFDVSDLADWADGTKQPMRISANLATYPPRMHSLKQTVASIYDQVDVIRICFNGMTRDDVPEYLHDLEYRGYDNMGKIQMIFLNQNLTDNGKFFMLDGLEFQQPEYYFTMDDDIVYPADYVSKTIEAIKTYGTIITYHGRILLGTHRDYYRGHKSFHCLGDQKGNHRIDVCGTGVTAFDTRYFHPKGLASSPNQKMSDIIFSLEASKQGKQIGCIAHKQGWITDIKHEETIHQTESRNCGVQNQLADEIYTLNYGK